MKKLGVVFLFGLASSVVNAADIEVGSGIEVLIVNGVKASESDMERELRDGENQLVVKVDARLREAGKTEYVTSNPYVVTFSYDSAADIEFSLKSKSVEGMTKLIASEAPFINISQSDQDKITSWVELPADDSYLPYIDPLKNLTAYNKENGFIFDGKNIRSLKQELANLSDAPVTIGAQPKAVHETENTLQLKLWYTRASKEEREQFLSWMNEQK